MIGIIDYGLGNLFSLEKALKRSDISYIVSSDRDQLASCDRYILSGVGHFRYGMQQLESKQLIPFIKESCVTAKKPLLGICLGMQLLGRCSEEGNVEGLGVINGDVTKLKVDLPFKIPHIGWNTLSKIKQSNLLPNPDQNTSYYFTHGFAYQSNCDDAVSMTQYGNANFFSAVEKENIYGVQFHPEKSFDQGLQLLKRFSAL